MRERTMSKREEPVRTARNEGRHPSKNYAVVPKTAGVAPPLFWFGAPHENTCFRSLHPPATGFRAKRLLDVATLGCWC